MQFPTPNNLDGMSQNSRSQGSPWRGSLSAGDDGAPSPFAAQIGQGLKIPNLPKLGSGNTPSSTVQRPQSHQPSFAQAVQKAQKGNPHAPSTKALNTKVISASAKSDIPARPNANQSPYPEPGMQILGSVNAQMMPRVDTSSGMSSLNTVLPGMSDNNRSKAAGDLRNLAHGIAHTPNVQNLSLNDRLSQSTSPSSRAAETDKYALKSLLGLMSQGNKEKQSVVLGSDLSQSGLNLSSSSERLSHTFASPWREMSKHSVIPDYRLPECYRIDTVLPQQQKLQNFDEGALFYIFYTMPRDAMQEAAAVELTNRSWRYHKELKMWLTKDPLSEPIQTNNQEESGIYIFFDPTTWKKIKREYILYYPDIA